MLGHEAVGSTMSGPAIRNWEMARVLAAEFPVVLAVPQAGGLQPEEFRLVEHSDNAATIRELAADADVILVSGYSVLKYPELARLGRRLIADVYDPYPIENLSLRCNQSLQQRTALSEMDFSTLKYLLRAGAFRAISTWACSPRPAGSLPAHFRMIQTSAS